MNRESYRHSKRDQSSTLTERFGDFIRNHKTLASIIGSAALVSGVFAITNESPSKYEERLNDISEINTDIEAVIIENGAIIRSEPGVDNTEPNIVATLKLDNSQVIVSTPEGVRVRQDSENGNWYGISKEDLESQDIIKSRPFDSDDSGYYWINGQLVEVVKTTANAD